MKKHLRVVFVALFLIAGLSAVASADVYMKQKIHSDGYKMMEQTVPANDMVQSMWMSQSVMRSDTGKQSMIIQLDKKMICLIDHSKKTYSEMSLDFKKALKEMGVTKEQQEQMNKFSRDLKMKFTVSATNERKKIGKWNCRKYIQTVEIMGNLATTESWATEDIKLDMNIYTRFNAAMKSFQPGMSNSMEAAEKEFKKIKGVIVYSESTAVIMKTKVKTITELLEFKEGAAPVGFFNIPAGYKKVSMAEASGK